MFNEVNEVEIEKEREIGGGIIRIEGEVFKKLIGGMTGNKVVDSREG